MLLRDQPELQPALGGSDAAARRVVAEGHSHPRCASAPARMRLLFAIKSLNGIGGGAERVLTTVASGLAKRGHEVHVLTLDPPGLPTFYHLSPAVGRIDLGIAVPGESLPRAAFLRAIWRVRRSVMTADSELVIPFMHSMYVPLTAALLGTRSRVVVSEHTSATHYRTRPLQRALVSLADRLAIAKTVPAATVRDEHPPKAREKVHVLANPVDLTQFARIPARPADGSLLLCVGRFTAEKNHAELIRAFARIAAEFPTWRLRLVGDGPLRSSLEKLVHDLGLTDRVTFAGFRSDVASEYARATAVALPSLYESFGLVAAEALASRRALVAFDCCLGVAEMVTHGLNGLLASACGDRVENLARCLHEVMSNEALRERLAAAGPASVSCYGAEAVVDAWERLLSRMSLRQP